MSAARLETPKPTHHLLTFNGQITFEFFEPIEEARGFLQRSLSRLDGVDQYALLLAELPPGKRLDDMNLKRFPLEYLQCAGASDRLTVEIRTSSGTAASQCVVGRSAQRSGEPEEKVRWEEHVIYVFEDELFDAVEATEIFVHYLTRAAVPAGFSLRTLQLGHG